MSLFFINIFSGLPFKILVLIKLVEKYFTVESCCPDKMPIIKIDINIFIYIIPQTIRDMIIETIPIPTHRPLDILCSYSNASASIVL